MAARFLDADKELTQTILSPIRNYENQPLVSLEEAVRTFENVNADLPTDICAAKQNSEDQVTDDHLTHDERASIYLYTMQQSIPHHLNEALRSDDRERLLPWLLFLKLFLTALWKLKPISSTVWRGIKGNYGTEFREKNRFFWFGVSSCIKSREILENEQFIGTTGARTLFRIDCINGIDIKNYSHHENEEEVLLLPCSYFEVLNVTEEEDLCIVHIREQEPPVRLIQPPWTNASLEAVKAVSAAPCEQLSRSKRRRQKQKQRHMAKIADASGVVTTEATESKSSSEQAMAIIPIAQISTQTLNFDRLKTKSQKVVTVKEGRRMAASEQYFLVCPKNRLRLLDTYGNEHWSTERDFEVDDVCYSAYLKQFLILADEDLYSLDVERPTKLTVEISQFARNMDECTCHENLFLVVKDFGGAIVELWDMKSNWKLSKTYAQPISCRVGQGICTIRFSSDGKHLGVTLTAPVCSESLLSVTQCRRYENTASCRTSFLRRLLQSL